jgi:rhodanese-related sulfurtransferase
VDEVGEALQMNPRDFKEKYHEVKPSKADNLVFSCLAGVRSKKAMDTAISLGFKRYVDKRKTEFKNVYFVRMKP